VSKSLIAYREKSHPAKAERLNRVVFSIHGLRMLSVFSITIRFPRTTLALFLLYHTKHYFV
jgi:hypothetical protein